MLTTPPPDEIPGESLPRAVQRLALAWLCLVVLSFGMLLEYTVTGGVAAEAPRTWPRDAHLERREGRPTLLVFIHPRCPCSRATLHELAWLAGRVGTRVVTQVMFLLPKGRDMDWAETDLWRRVGEIDGVERRIDAGGALAARFGAHTSGQALLYDSAGQLRFAGGLTPTRGHQGDSVGRQAVLALAGGEAVPSAHARVFGCPLRAGGPTGTCPSLVERAERTLVGVATCGLVGEGR